MVILFFCVAGARGCSVEAAAVEQRATCQLLGQARVPRRRHARGPGQGWRALRLYQARRLTAVGISGAKISTTRVYNSSQVYPPPPPKKKERKKK